MPPVSGIPGQAKTLVQPAPALDSQADLPPQPSKESKAEPATMKMAPEAQIPMPAPQRSQDELAAEAILTQTVRRRSEMTPNENISKTPSYQFTEKDRENAAKARWALKYPWETAPMDEALAHLAEIRAETEKGGILLQKRVSELRVERVKCFGCENIINISEGRWAGMRTRNNFETGLPESAYACSAACMLRLNREFTHPIRVPTPKDS